MFKSNQHKIFLYSGFVIVFFLSFTGNAYTDDTNPYAGMSSEGMLEVSKQELESQKQMIEIIKVIQKQKQHQASQIKQDIAQIKQDAKNGDVFAQLKLGNMYCAGKGVSQDYFSALIWYRKAAKQKHPVAINNIGLLNFYGYGTPQDYEKAYELFKVSALLGYNDALDNLEIVAGKLTTDQIKRINEELDKFKK